MDGAAAVAAVHWDAVVFVKGVIVSWQAAPTNWGGVGTEACKDEVSVKRISRSRSDYQCGHKNAVP